MTALDMLKYGLCREVAFVVRVIELGRIRGRFLSVVFCLEVSLGSAVIVCRFDSIQLKLR